MRGLVCGLIKSLFAGFVAIVVMFGGAALLVAAFVIVVLMVLVRN